MSDTHYDVAIIGGGPAGLQATLILSRLRKRILVFDSPEPPRNAASHGVHNFVGLDGLTYRQIRDQAWEQINVYQSAERRVHKVTDVQPASDGHFIVTDDAGQAITAEHVILANGFKDIYPEAKGFLDCWGDTILMCPFCDGYENRDRVWGLVITSEKDLAHKPLLYTHWTKQAKCIVSPDMTISPEIEAQLNAKSISIHRGIIADIHHTDGKIHAVTLDSGETVDVQTLWWTLNHEPQALTTRVIADFGLELEENGTIKTDAFYQTSTPKLWAVGDIKGWATALGAAYAGSQAAYAISRPSHS
jgi:thioredoxin reductase